MSSEKDKKSTNEEKKKKKYFKQKEKKNSHTQNCGQTLCKSHLRFMKRSLKKFLCAKCPVSHREINAVLISYFFHISFFSFALWCPRAEARRERLKPSHTYIHI